MITQNLVDLIESGQAQFRNWVTGATGSSRIPCPRNNYIVITGFTWFHFSEIDSLVEKKNDEQMLLNSTHQLLFRSYGQEYFYGIRSSFVKLLLEAGQGKYVLQPTTNDTTIDCYQLHKTDIHIDIWRMSPVEDWLPSFSQLSDKTTEPPAPSGYGTFPTGVPALNVTRKITFPSTQEYFPYGENQGLPLSDGFQENFRDAITLQTALLPNNPVNTPQNQHNFPLLNISYVLVNHPFDKQNR